MCAPIKAVKEWLIVDKDDFDGEVGLNFGRFGAYRTNWPGQWRIGLHIITVLQDQS